MKKMLMVCLMAAMGALSSVAQSIYDFKVTNDEGKEVSQFDKIDVNGEHAAPLYVWLKSQKGFCSFNTEDKIGKFLDERFKKQDPDYAKNPDIKWNFTKFLVSKDGSVLQRFEPTATAADMEPAIKAALNGGCCVKSEKTGCCAKTEKSCCKQDETACCK